MEYAAMDRTKEVLEPKEGEEYLIAKWANASDLQDKIGTRVRVKKVITEADRTHDPETLPMYLVEVSDKDDPNWLSDIEVWSDELEEISS